VREGGKSLFVYLFFFYEESEGEIVGDARERE